MPVATTTSWQGTGQARYTLRQAAEIAHCCYETVWRAVKRGDLTATRRGQHGRYLVAESDLMAWAFPKARP